VNLIEAVEKQFPSVIQRIREEERERCARIADHFAAISNRGTDFEFSGASIARKIREGSK
jgi:hypothetical protein